MRTIPVTAAQFDEMAGEGVDFGTYFEPSEQQFDSLDDLWDACAAIQEDVAAAHEVEESVRTVARPVALPELNLDFVPVATHGPERFTLHFNTVLKSKHQRGGLAKLAAPHKKAGRYALAQGEPAPRHPKK